MRNALSKRIIALHLAGFEGDFIRNDHQQLVCVQDNQAFSPETYDILICQSFFDPSLGGLCYIYGIVTPYGYKGILVSKNQIDGHF